MAVDGFPAADAVGVGDGEEGVGGGGLAGEEDAGFFEEFADPAGAVGGGIDVPGCAGGGDGTV